MDEPSWKKLKLSLERPYKDDNGNPIPALYDITTDGQYVYEPKETLTKQLGEKWRRVFTERGVDFFEKGKRRSSSKGDSLMQEMDIDNAPSQEEGQEEHSADKSGTSSMTTEDLLKMRMEIVPHLHIALGEMSHARDLLSSLLGTKPLLGNQLAQESPQSTPPSSHISATIVNKASPILSVQVFNAQLSIGGKDEALRKASDVFKTASENMENARLQGEKYWLDALKIRRGNWRLVPAPLPFGSSTAKGADRTAKDFLIVYGLEESPPFFRRQAIAHMATTAEDIDHLVFPHRRHTRLRVSIASSGGRCSQYHPPNAYNPLDKTDVSGSLQVAQQEIVEQEIFSLLVKEAADLPTALGRVSERAIFIDAAPGMELRFELVNSDTIVKQQVEDTDSACRLVYHGLQILLLRRQTFLKAQRLGPSRDSPSTSRLPPILQPIIDLLQYQVFCKRIKSELDKAVWSLTAVGITSALSFIPVGETGRDLLDHINKGGSSLMSGEVILRIDNRYGIRFTFEAPSSLTAHLSQATISITSLPQLRQLLMDEVERCLLQRMCDVGKALSESVGGSWFVDLDKCIGRWDGCVLNLRMQYGEDYAIDCITFRLDEVTGRHGQSQAYKGNGKHVPLLEWVAGIVRAACERRL